MQNHKNSTKILFITKGAIAKARTYSKDEYFFSLFEQLAFYERDGWKIVIVSGDKEIQDPSDEFMQYVSDLKEFMRQLSRDAAYIDQCVFCVEPGSSTGTLAYTLSEVDQLPRHFKLPSGVSGMRMPHPGMVLHVLQNHRANPENCLFVGLNEVELKAGENAKVPHELLTGWMKKVPPGLS